MTFLRGDMLEHALAATGRSIPPENSVHGLENLPQHILDDLNAIHEKCVSSLYAFAYLYHVSDAPFGDVKHYLDQRGWLRDVD
ncbi:hypothetical protein INH39_28125 [Massilia violaceinigra]|uniref:Uncharacterized protein n=1 Tax=Massilia violaceinigra TaxID=2045208 RepID=A0ABY4A3A3_9BURK|nr:hypothetical protein [Massilia violaceinigra]UOD29240.1 hypothetical protein INH39_28125 [Massilia violaceinigra]